jgi:hypothetical protein
VIMKSSRKAVRVKFPKGILGDYEKFLKGGLGDYDKFPKGGSGDNCKVPERWFG